MKVIIVGGVAGGASAAARLRRLDEKAEIIMFEMGPYISFANCGLPYHVGNVIKERDELLVQTPENMEGRFNISVKVNHEVTKINRKEKTVEVKNLETGEVFEETYDKIVLSPGASPIVPPIKGIDEAKVYPLTTMPDMDKVIEEVNSGVKSVVVVGGGFIGVELAENLLEKGLKVSLIEMQPQVLTFLDPDMAAIVHREMIASGIDLRLNDQVKELEKNGDKTNVVLSSGDKILTEMVIMGVGVLPRTKLAKDAGIKLGTTGAIQVNDKMRTSDKDIYAVGDAIEIKHYVTGDPMKLPLAGPANRQARIAVNNICGIKTKYRGTQGTSIIKVFDLACSSTGANEFLLKKNETEYKTITTIQGSHAGYYPGAYAIHLKILFSEKDGKLYGAQVVGYDGVDKRIDVLASVIRFGGTIYDLEDLELAYAPPFGSAKDPVNMLGFIAVNSTSGFSPTVSVMETDKYIDKDTFIIDVRDEDEIHTGMIDKAVHIPGDSIRSRMNEIPKDKKIFLYCKMGLRGYIAQRILLQNGYENVVNLSGGFESYNVYAHPELWKDYIPTMETIDDTQTEIHKNEETNIPNVKIDCCGMQCPGPLLKLKQACDTAKPNEIIQIEASDQGFYNDVKAYAERMNLKVLELKKGKTIRAKLKKCDTELKDIRVTEEKNHITIVVFSCDFDKVMATLIIANGALAMGKKVSLFFTFWGLNVLRKNCPIQIEKTFIEKAFGWMMPRGTKKLVLSKMNMMGAGTAMIKGIMKQYNVDSIDSLLENLIKCGGELVACSMSMQLMGIKMEEMIDGVEEGGVATYLNNTDKGTLNLFI